MVNPVEHEKHVIFDYYSRSLLQSIFDQFVGMTSTCGTWVVEQITNALAIDFPSEMPLTHAGVSNVNECLIVG